jgi:hypothetical protein
MLEERVNQLETQMRALLLVPEVHKHHTKLKEDADAAAKKLADQQNRDAQIAADKAAGVTTLPTRDILAPMPADPIPAAHTPGRYGLNIDHTTPQQHEEKIPTP